MNLAWEQVRGWRMARQHLDERVPAARALDVASTNRFAGASDPCANR